MENYQIKHFIASKKYSDAPQFEICLAENDSTISFDLKSVLWYQIDGDWYRYNEDWEPLAVVDSSAQIHIYSKEVSGYPIPIPLTKYYFSTSLDGKLHSFKKKNVLEQYPQHTALHHFLSSSRIRKRNRQTGKFEVTELLNND